MEKPWKYPLITICLPTLCFPPRFPPVHELFTWLSIGSCTIFEGFHTAFSGCGNFIHRMWKNIIPVCAEAFIQGPFSPARVVENNVSKPVQNGDNLPAKFQSRNFSTLSTYYHAHHSNSLFLKRKRKRKERIIRI